MTPPRVLLADDHTLVAEAFKQLLEPEYSVVGTVTDGRTLLAVAPKLNPDIILLDISMPPLQVRSKSGCAFMIPVLASIPSRRRDIEGSAWLACASDCTSSAERFRSRPNCGTAHGLRLAYPWPRRALGAKSNSKAIYQ